MRGSKFGNLKRLGYLIGLAVLTLQCKHNATVNYQYFQPDYYSWQLVSANDSLIFPLDSTSYNAIKSFNYFVDKGTEYISFYDDLSNSIMIYQFKSKSLIKKILLKNILPDKKVYKTTVFTKSLDSIFIASYLSLYMLDTTGTIKDSIAYRTKPDIVVSSLDNLNPPILKDNILFTEARPRLDHTNKKDLRKWKVLYQFDLKKKASNIGYQLPKTYQDNIYSYFFFYNSYCYNDKGRFVFSFPADTCIYETDLHKYHNAYYAKSKHQNEAIQPVIDMKELSLGEGATKLFQLSDSYGAIYFDPFNKRYLRVAEQKLKAQDIANKKIKKQQSIIILNEEFKIIGESTIDERISLSFVFLAIDGRIYARTNIKNQNSLDFVRLTYSASSDSIKLSKR